MKTRRERLAIKLVDSLIQEIGLGQVPPKLAEPVQGQPPRPGLAEKLINMVKDAINTLLSHQYGLEADKEKLDASWSQLNSAIPFINGQGELPASFNGHDLPASDGYPEVEFHLDYTENSASMNQIEDVFENTRWTLEYDKEFGHFAQIGVDLARPMDDGRGGTHDMFYVSIYFGEDAGD